MISHGVRMLIFDPKTSAVLGETNIAVRASNDGGTVIPKGTGATGVSNSVDQYPNGTAVGSV